MNFILKRVLSFSFCFCFWLGFWVSMHHIEDRIHVPCILHLRYTYLVNVIRSTWYNFVYLVRKLNACTNRQSIFCLSVTFSSTEMQSNALRQPTHWALVTVVVGLFLFYFLLLLLFLILMLSGAVQREWRWKKSGLDPIHPFFFSFFFSLISYAYACVHGCTNRAYSIQANAHNILAFNKM